MLLFIPSALKSIIDSDIQMRLKCLEFQNIPAIRTKIKKKKKKGNSSQE